MPPANEENTVPRNEEYPSADAVFDEMDVCEPYTVGELTEQFVDASRWTIQRRLDDLVTEDEIEKKKHSANRVTYWRDR